MSAKPWDARLAHRLVQPFKDSWVTPNYFTTLRLIVGLASCVAFASGRWPNLGSVLFALSNFLDHTDGELARMSDKTTRFGHLYDLTSDALIHILLFVSIGIGLWNMGSGVWTIPAGILAGLAVAAIFQLRHEIEERLGKMASRQPNFAGFEAEDVLYLLLLVTLAECLEPFLIAAAVGAPIATVLVGAQYLHMRRDTKI
jgi:phosphatidylglycerophosphate synthase